MDIPESVLSIARVLDGAGYEVWCVGGALRDYLLQVEGGDVDLATSAPPERVRKLFRRSIPIGIEHGTVAVFGSDRRPHEVTTFRRDVRTDGRHAVVEFGASLIEDLARRDFTINAIAYHPLRHEWQDPFDGVTDLEAGVIRAVGDPVRRFREDYLRILRAVRFAARFDFTIEAATWDAACQGVGNLVHLSAERVRDEWEKGLRTARVTSGLVGRWRDVGAFEAWMPEVIARVTPGSDSLVAVDRLPPDPVLITARLSPDPATTLRRLRASNAQIGRAAAIREYRDTIPAGADAITVRRWLAHVGAAADDLLRLHEADGGSAELVEAVAAIRQSGAPLCVGDLAVSGTDLMEAGVPQGPAVGRLLETLLERVLETPELNERSRLMAVARELMVDRDG